MKILDKIIQSKEPPSSNKVIWLKDNTLYGYKDGEWTTLGISDLSNYYTKDEIDQLLSEYTSLEALATTLANYSTTSQMNSAISAHHDSSKINEPSQEGTNGQVLTTDGQGGRTWTTVQGGGNASIAFNNDGSADITNGTTTQKFLPQNLVAKYGVISQTITYNADGTRTLSNIQYGWIPQSLIYQAQIIDLTFNNTSGYFESSYINDYSLKDVCDSLTLLPSIGVGGIANIAPNVRYSIINMKSSGYFNFNSLCLFSSNINELKFLSYTSMSVNNIGVAFRGATRLQYINVIIVLTTGYVFDASTFKDCNLLKYIHIKALSQNIEIKNSSLLQNESILYMIRYAANGTTDITITLHADAYTRAMADTDIQNALELNGHITLATA